MKHGYKGDIESLTKENDNFRHVIYTGQHVQLVLMSLAPGEEIGMEVHEDNDQFFRFESGNGTVIVGETTYDVADGDAVIVPSGTRHNVVNTGDESLKLYTLYTPPHHQDGITRETKEEAEADAPEFDGETTE